jgi:hypothetical protein
MDLAENWGGKCVSGTIPQENSLNQHGTGDILGMVRLAHHDKIKTAFIKLRHYQMG